jgi:imidazole glycerol-phosphate synthase subunit HisH
MITIVDYGVGNLGSIKNMFNRIGVDALISSDFDTISSASKLLLPGVGSYDHCMKNLQKSGLIELLTSKVLDENVPILGICVGFQLMFSQSEEGVLPGLGWIKGKVLKFKFDKNHQDLKTPHMGWNTVVCKKQSSLLDYNDTHEVRFYFAHSFYAKCDNEEDVLCSTQYGADFTSGIESGNIMAVQFHPEKSHQFGMKLFKKFAEV